MLVRDQCAVVGGVGPVLGLVGPDPDFFAIPNDLGEVQVMGRDALCRDDDSQPDSN